MGFQNHLKFFQNYLTNGEESINCNRENVIKYKKNLIIISNMTENMKFLLESLP